MQCSGTPNAITDNIIDLIAWTPNLTFLDISFAKNVTDDGMHHFKDRTLPIKKLFINGLTSLSALGLSEILQACQKSVRILEAAFLDQETMNSQICHPISHCFELEELDLTGNCHIGDDGITQLPKGELKDHNGKVIEVVGLPNLRLLKLGGINKMTDHSLMKLCNTSKVLEHLELTKCELLTEYSIDGIIKQNPSLVFLDLNGIPAITQPILDTLRQLKPELLIRRFLYQNIDPKDNELRVPRRLMGEKKKKKKGKKGGKKKK